MKKQQTEQGGCNARETYKPRRYCTQPRAIGDGCETCGLVSYGRDCRNNPVKDHEPHKENDHVDSM